VSDLADNNDVRRGLNLSAIGSDRFRRLVGVGAAPDLFRMRLRRQGRAGVICRIGGR